MSKIVNQLLQKVTKGTGIVFLGAIAGILLAFTIRVLLARYFTRSEYGVYSLAVVILNIFVMISSMGLPEGSTRQIAYYRGRNDLSKLHTIVISTLQIILITSIFLSALLFFISGVISTKIFHIPALSTPLKIISAVIPFSLLRAVFVSLFRGFDEVKPKVYFDMLRDGLFILLLGLAILLGLGFLEVMYAFLSSAIISCVTFAAYTIKKAPFTIKRERLLTINSTGKELLFFSLPLLGATMLAMIIDRTDTLMLGYFKTPEVVGLYNSALPLARLIPLILSSMGFIYVPIVSRLYAQNMNEEVKKSYQVLTKWIFSLSFPLFSILFLFPESVLNCFFGSRYVEAAPALRILSLGFIFHISLGPNGMTLLTMGKTRLLMWANLVAALLNVILNLSLIPLWGIAGAALASLISYSAANIFCSMKLYQLSKIHPFTKSYLKPIIISIIIIFIIHVFSRRMLAVKYWMLPIIFVLVLFVYALFILLTRSLDNEDIMLLLAVENRTKINAERLRGILRRFIRYS